MEMCSTEGAAAFASKIIQKQTLVCIKLGWTIDSIFMEKQIWDFCHQTFLILLPLTKRGWVLQLYVRTIHLSIRLTGNIQNTILKAVTIYPFFFYTYLRTVYVNTRVTYMVNMTDWAYEQ